MIHPLRRVDGRPTPGWLVAAPRTHSTAMPPDSEGCQVRPLPRRDETMMRMNGDYEDVTTYTLDADVEEQLLLAHNECTFIWSNREGWPVGVIMSYVWRRGAFWLTAPNRVVRQRTTRRGPAGGLRGRASRHRARACRPRSGWEKGGAEWFVPAAGVGVVETVVGGEVPVAPWDVEFGTIHRVRTPRSGRMDSTRPSHRRRTLR